ncbi:MAG: hypothetical protein JST93_06980 [Acidobacteria bacterium]|nr:hypothetical protein [Acidobacteriota bacterium]
MGRLTEAERLEIESLVFEDDDFDSRMQEAESDLLDDWARGRLSPADAEAVLTRFSPQQRSLATLLARRAQPVSPSPKRPVRLWLAIAAMLCIAISSAYLLRRPAETAPPEPVAQVPPRTNLQILALHTPSTRGASVPLFRLSPQAATIRITAPATGGFATYELALESASAPFRAQAVPSQGVLSLDLPASNFPVGNCDLLVFAPDGALLATYAFHVVRD